VFACGRLRYCIDSNHFHTFSVISFFSVTRGIARRARSAAPRALELRTFGAQSWGRDAYVPVRRITSRPVTWHYIASRYVALHRVTFRCITSRPVTRNYIASRSVALRHVPVRCITSRPVPLHYITSRYVVLHHVPLRRILSLLRRITSRYAAISPQFPCLEAALCWRISRLRMEEMAIAGKRLRYPWLKVSWSVSPASPWSDKLSPVIVQDHLFRVGESS